jgi:adenosylmethionine-8-amino-7-oxononanoate aminotransferase
VALTNLDLLVGADNPRDKPAGLLAKLPGKIEQLRSHLLRMAELPHVGDVRQQGLMTGIELVKDKRAKTLFPPEKRMGAVVCRSARDQGVFLRPLGDVIVIMPPLAIEETLLDRLCSVVYNCLAILGR